MVIEKLSKCTGGTAKVLSLQKSVLRSKLYSQFDTQTLSADGIQNDQTRATECHLLRTPPGLVFGE